MTAETILSSSSNSSLVRVLDPGAHQALQGTLYPVSLTVPMHSVLDSAKVKGLML